jgi:DNA replication and repair protein RecF
LFDEVARLAGQVWMTGADPAAFADIVSQAAVFDVTPGAAERRKSSA